MSVDTQNTTGRNSTKPQNQPRTWCRNGLHRMTPDNVYKNPGGKRQCRPCRDRSRNRYWEKRREANAEAHRDHEAAHNRRGQLVCYTCQRGDLDVDEVAVWRTVVGVPPERVTAAEMEAAVHELMQQGLQRPDITTRVQRDSSTVQRAMRSLQHRTPNTEWKHSPLLAGLPMRADDNTTMVSTGRSNASRISPLLSAVRDGAARRAA